MKDKNIQYFLDAWDKSLTASQIKSFSNLESRRYFLKQLLSLSVITTFPMVVSANTNNLDTPVWKTLASVHMHMFPISNGEPDALSINATAFLKSVIEWPGVESDDKKFILDGVGWLNELSQKQYKKDFVHIDSHQKESILRVVEKSQAGENWLSLILLYLMEALLTDPVYGGNVNGVGWKWLQHQPGFPRPQASKRYFNL